MKKKMSFFGGLLLLMLCMTVIGKATETEVQAAEVSLVRGEEVFYEGYSTFYYYIDGKLGYCLEPRKNSPHTGNFQSDLLDNHTLLSKGLYYVYGGPGFDSYVKPMLSAQWQEPSKAYCLSHCVLSCIYDDCRLDGDTFTGMSQTMKQQVVAVVDAIRGFPEIPKPDFTFSKAVMNAAFSMEEGVQRTEEIQCMGDTDNSVEIPLPEGVVLVNKTRGTRTEGKGTVWGGDNFYFLTDVARYNGEIWKSGALYGKNRQSWRSLVIMTGEGGQHIGTGTLVTAEVPPVSLEITWLPVPEIEVAKQADRENKKFKVGDLVTYSIDITQKIPQAVARNVQISDTILTEGVKLQKNSIVLLDKNQSIISDAIISVKGNSYNIQAGGFLQGAETGEKYTVEYQVVITSESVIGKEILNEVTVSSENTEDVRDEEKITVEEEEKPKETVTEEKPREEPVNLQPKEELKMETAKADIVKTGDDQNLMVLSVLLILSCTVLFICGRISRKIK